MQGRSKEVSVTGAKQGKRRAAGNAVVETARFLITQHLRHWRRDTGFYSELEGNNWKVLSTGGAKIRPAFYMVHSGNAANDLFDAKVSWIQSFQK